jgi:hypothetical protein
MMAKILHKSPEITRPQEFVLEDYKSLRREVEALQSEARLVAQVALGGGLAIYAWLATNEGQGLAKIGWWVPVTIPIFVLFHFADHMNKVGRISQYIRTYIEINNYYGWESFLYDNRNTKHSVFVRLSKITGLSCMIFSSGSIIYIVFWLSLLSITISIATCYSLNFCIFGGNSILPQGCCS